MNFDLSRRTKLFLDEPIVLVRLHTFDCGAVAPCDDYAVASAGSKTPSFQSKVDLKLARIRTNRRNSAHVQSKSSDLRRIESPCSPPEIVIAPHGAGPQAFGWPAGTHSVPIWMPCLHSLRL